MQTKELKRKARLEKGVSGGEASQLIKAPGLETEQGKWEAGTKVEMWRRHGARGKDAEESKSALTSDRIVSVEETSLHLHWGLYSDLKV